jgi:hypothetical protein
MSARIYRESRVREVRASTVVLPTFVLALLVILYTARSENKLAAPRR